MHMFYSAAVSMRFESMEVSASEGDCVVNVTIEMDGESTVDSRVFVRTAQVGSAVGKNPQV